MSTKRSTYAATLRGLTTAEIPGYLDAHSNLPGPRGNLELIDAAADVLPRTLALSLAASPGEFLACCGVATLGRLALDDPDDPEPVQLLTHYAADERWRVREASAIAGQRIGDADPVRLRTLVEHLINSPDPLVVRCGIATICEPRLLADPRTAAAALVACDRATGLLTRTPAEQRRQGDVRTLRQALGYCWSVAIAAAPEAGLAAFEALDVTDPEVAWVVRENRRKRRLAVLLES
ncbi:MAG: HEAT repeat domain-containing protein [Micropruina sp.]|nr:HEAT repeat domain-containing protein [Micropruina sp.]